MSRPPEFSARDAHALVLCEHLAGFCCAHYTHHIESEGVTYEVSVVAIGQGAKTREELEDALESQTQRAMRMFGVSDENQLHVCGQCDGTGYVA